MGNQFSFKPKFGTDIGIYSLKESIDSYSKLNGCVQYSLFYAFNAFDGVKHSIYLLNC